MTDMCGLLVLIAEMKVEGYIFNDIGTKQVLHASETLH